MIYTLRTPREKFRIESKLRSSSIFAFPSAFEGLSLSMLEAMAIGLPIVGCLDCPSVNTTIQNCNNGLLTQPTPESYSEGLAKLMVNEELRCRLGAQARIDTEVFAPSRVWAQWDTLIQTCLKND